jgi:hypothetical protein
MTATAEIGKGNGINFNQDDFIFTASDSNTEGIVIVVDERRLHFHLARHQLIMNLHAASYRKLAS